MWIRDRDGDVARATEMFQEDCYWRDLVTFTWNIKTMEAREQVSDMLNAQLAATKPSNWQVADGETPTDEDGLVTAWITFETLPLLHISEPTRLLSHS